MIEKKYSGTLYFISVDYFRYFQKENVYVGKGLRSHLNIMIESKNVIEMRRTQ